MYCRDQPWRRTSLYSSLMSDLPAALSKARCAFEVIPRGPRRRHSGRYGDDTYDTSWKRADFVFFHYYISYFYHYCIILYLILIIVSRNLFWLFWILYFSFCILVRGWGVVGRHPARPAPQALWEVRRRDIWYVRSYDVGVEGFYLFYFYLIRCWLKIWGVWLIEGEHCVWCLGFKVDGVV